MTETELHLEALSAHVRQRSGLDFANYGDVAAYRSEQRSITRDLHDFRALMRAVQWRTTTREQWERAFSAYSGRLACEYVNGGLRLEYTTGQYFPTEYRRAACAVLASLIWDLTREGWPALDGHGLRARLRKEFGRGIARRWFS